MTVSQDMDPKVCFLFSIDPSESKTKLKLLQEALKNFLDCKTSMLADTESRCISMNERKERILAEISQLNVSFNSLVNISPSVL